MDSGKAVRVLLQSFNDEVVDASCMLDVTCSSGKPSLGFQESYERGTGHSCVPVVELFVLHGCNSSEFAVNVAIEVKVGRDKLSEHQIRIKQDIEQAGGYYIVARDWPTFIEQWDAIT